MKRLAFLFLILSSVSSQSYADHHGGDDGIVSVTVAGKGGDYVGDDFSIPTEARQRASKRRLAIQWGKEKLIEAGYRSDSIFPLSTKFTHWKFDVSSARVIINNLEMFQTDTAWQADVRFLAIGADRLDDSIRITRIKVYDGSTYVAGFDYHSKLSDFGLKKLLVYSPGVGTTLRPIASMQPNIGSEFVALNSLLVDYKKSHSKADYSLFVEFDFNVGVPQHYELASNTEEVFKLIRPTFFGRFTSNYRKAVEHFESLVNREKAEDGVNTNSNCLGRMMEFFARSRL